MTYKYIFGILFVSIVFIFSSIGEVNAVGKGFWHVSGKNILDENNKVVRIAGVGWGIDIYKKVRDTRFFATAEEGLPGVNYKDVLDGISNFGFNTIRFAFSNAHLDSDCKYVDSGGKNPELNNKTCLEAMDMAIDYATNVKGLRIILDRMGISGFTSDPLWYSDDITEVRWINDWKFLANRYKNNKYVIGVDLANEPNVKPGEKNGIIFPSATWGTGDIKTDWKMAAEKAGKAVLSVNPNLLIFVESIVGYPEDLQIIKTKPVNLPKKNLVYSIHVYPGFTWGQNDEQTRRSEWTRRFGFITQENIAPVWVGEYAPYPNSEQYKYDWTNQFVTFMKENGITGSLWAWRKTGDVDQLPNNDFVTSSNKKWVGVVKSFNDPLERNVPSTQTVTPSYTTSPSPTLKPSKTPTASLSPTFKQGDANGDGLVNGLDYVIWLNTYSQKGSSLPADFNHDGVVDGLDYVVWLTNYN